MMNTKLQNFINLFRNTRARIILLLTVGIFLLTFLVGLLRFSRGVKSGPSAEVQLNTIQNIQSIPGGLKASPSAEYQALQEKQNILQAQIAQETGRSAIPTIVESTMLKPPVVQSPCCCTPCDASGMPTANVSKRLTPGTPIYDAQGRLIGTLGADGKIKTDLPPGTPIYDADGRLIGTIGAEGVVQTDLLPGTSLYDKHGLLLGTLNEEGKVCNNLSPGLSLYDEQGQLIETVLSEGILQNDVPAGTSVYDEHSQWMGILGEGKICRDLPPDTALYNAQGQLIGTVNAAGVIHGKVDSGTPIYDAEGRLIGRLGPDGKIQSNLPAGTPIYDAEGRRVGTIGQDGELRPFIAASETFPSGASDLSITDHDLALQAVVERQAMQMSQQEERMRLQELQGAIGNQVNQLLGVWVIAPSQQAVMGEAGVTDNKVSELNSTNQAIAVKAGTVMYALLETAINSDEPGPVLAKIVEGPFKGGRLLGTLSLSGERVRLEFNTLSLPKAKKTVQISTVAIDHATARTALSSHTDRHILLRYGSLFASSFIEGYGQAVQKSGMKTTKPPEGTKGPIIEEYPKLNPEEKVLVALGNTGAKVGANLAGQFNTPPTVHVYQGTPIGVLFTKDLAEAELPQEN